MSWYLLGDKPLTEQKIVNCSGVNVSDFLKENQAL